MGRAQDPRSAAIGGSCENLGLAKCKGGRGNTAKAAGPDRASLGRAKATALWRAADRRERRRMNIIQQLEAEQIESLTQIRAIPEFRPGDTLRVGVKVVEGD